MSIGATARRSSSSSSSNGGGRMVKRPGKRPGRKPSKIDEHAKLERSRQSARECRARKKLRYQYLEELVLNREKAVFALRDELETYQRWCEDVEDGHVPPELREKLSNESSTSPLSTCKEELDFSTVVFDRDSPETQPEMHTRTNLHSNTLTNAQVKKKHEETAK
jgi:hypothetical protein